MHEKALYKKLVRLAYTNPGPVRDALMPLLKGKTGGIWGDVELIGDGDSNPEVAAEIASGLDDWAEALNLTWGGVQISRRGDLLVATIKDPKWRRRGDQDAYQIEAEENSARYEQSLRLHLKRRKGWLKRMVVYYNFEGVYTVEITLT